MKNLLIIFVFILLNINLFAQDTLIPLDPSKLSDSDIGFKREIFITEALEMGMNTNETEIFIEKIRQDFINRYVRLHSNEPTTKMVSNGGNQSTGNCENVNFENGNFSGWCYYWDDHTYQPANIAGEHACDNFTTIPSDNGDLRFKIQSLTDANDPYIGSVTNGQPYSLKLGNSSTQSRIEQARRTFVATIDNPILEYNFAIVLQDPGHEINSQPYFKVYLEKSNGDKIQCSEYYVVAGTGIPGFLPGSNGVVYKPWSKNSINLLQYVAIGETVTLVVEVSDCKAGGHFGYAYFYASCQNAGISTSTDKICINESITFSNPAIGSYSNSSYLWTFYDNYGSYVLGTSTDPTPSFTFVNAGDYTVSLSITNPSLGTNQSCSMNFSELITVINCDTSFCDSCINFAPSPGKRYWVSGWVKENHTTQQINYTQSKIEIEFLNDQNVISTVSFTPSGGIIDDWQRIVGDFIVPANTTDISINLVNNNTSIDNFFDDIRVHPFNASMKSYVYDPVTFLLTAELDDNNYATFYEYDSENQLIGIKKETARGIVTIQEGRFNLQKP